LSKKTRGVRDKWKRKVWLTIFSPPYFGEIELGTTPYDEDSSNIFGRVISTTLYDITKDMSHQSIKLYFRMTDIQEKKVNSIFIGHEYAPDYLKSLIRRGSSRIDCIYNVTTNDGYKLRVSFVGFTLVRVKSSQKKIVRQLSKKIIEEKAKALNFEQFVHEAVLGKIASDIYNEGKKIVPFRHVGIRKTKLISPPEVAVAVNKTAE